MANALVTLCVDARRNRVANFSAENAKYTDEAIRQAFMRFLEMTNSHSRIGESIRLRFLKSLRKY